MNANQPAHTSATAITSLVFGVLSWVLLPLLGAILAVVFGHIARAEIRKAPPGQIEGDGLAIAGLVLGWLHLVVVIMAICIIIVFFGGIALLAGIGH